MAGSGLLQSFTFGGLTFDTDNCVQSAGVNTSLQTGQYQCSGIMKNVVGAKSFSFNYSLAIPVANDSEITALDVGSTSTFVYYPFGNTATYIKLTATRGVSTALNISAPANGVVTVDGTIVLDDLTVGAAT